MKGFEVCINGNAPLVAVSDNLVAAIITIGYHEGEDHINVGGMDSKSCHLLWFDKEIKLGDRIKIRTIERETASVLKERYPVDRKQMKDEYFNLKNNWKSKDCYNCQYDMLGLIVKYSNNVYKVGIPGGGIILSSCVVRNEFILEASGGSSPFVGIFLRFRTDIEVEIEVAEFNETSASLSENNELIIDTDYEDMRKSESEEEWMLKRFHVIETILKEEGEID